MALDNDLVEMMDSTITVYPFQSINSAGESAFSSSGTTYKAHLRGRARLIRTGHTREVLSVLDVYTNATSIGDRDKVVLPVTTASGAQYIMLGVTTIHDETGIVFQIVHFGDALSHRNLG